MSETLLAVLLVTNSAKGSNLVYHWPPSPSLSPRLTRPRPVHDADCSHLDGFWEAASNLPNERTKDSNTACNIRGDSLEDGWEYEWKRPRDCRHRSRSFAAASRSRPASRRGSPNKDHSRDRESSHNSDEEGYDYLLDYPTEFLANILCPQRTLCHQKFELLVDDLAFIGHPVCSEVDGEWKFKPERSEQGTRGRGSRNRKTDEKCDGASKRDPSPMGERTASSLGMFHLVLVMDLPDPSSSASGNLFKYFHVIYEHIAITVTAVLFQEQVQHSFMDRECEELNVLRERCAAKGEPFAAYNSQALQISTLARSIKALYESIKSNSIARLEINELSIQLQLPPYLDALLHTDDDDVDYIAHDDPDLVSWSSKLSFGWRLPSLAPWKSLLLLDIGVEHGDLVNNLRRPVMSPEDQELAEGLIHFLETASIFDSLAVMAHSLNWDLETQVYPTVRWLVEHRKAKVVDTVHRGLKTVFVLPATLSKPLPELCAEFAQDFANQSVPPLSQIFATMSSATAPVPPRRGQSDNHFFATVVCSKDLVPLYSDVVRWLLKRELLVTLHLRVRVVATPEVKLRVRCAREEAAAKRHRRGYNGTRRRGERGHENAVADDHEDVLRVHPEYTHGRARRVSSRSNGSELTGSVVRKEYEELEVETHIEDGASDTGDDETSWDKTEDNLLPSIIPDPGQATPLQRRWLKAMSEYQEPYLADRFKQINQYFDGKRTDDEILYRADITRKQLREVLHHYEEYLLVFLHPA